MSASKDLFVKRFGNNYDDIKNSPWYLSELSLNGAIEIDNYLLGRNNDFSHVRELAEILEEFQLEDTHTTLTLPIFPYLPLWRAMKNDSDKDIRKISELALEMKLFRSELGDVPTNSEQLEGFRSLLCTLSRELEQEQHSSFNYLVA